MSSASLVLEELEREGKDSAAVVARLSEGKKIKSNIPVTVEVVTSFIQCINCGSTKGIEEFDADQLLGDGRGCCKQCVTLAAEVEFTPPAEQKQKDNGDAKGISPVVPSTPSRRLNLATAAGTVMQLGRQGQPVVPLSVNNVTAVPVVPSGGNDMWMNMMAMMANLNRMPDIVASTIERSMASVLVKHLPHPVTATVALPVAAAAAPPKRSRKSVKPPNRARESSIGSGDEEEPQLAPQARRSYKARMVDGLAAARKKVNSRSEERRVGKECSS